ncbi:MAG TPA: ABC transporter permease [Pirellulales bacterium]|nr:ABC transporter permease [Pirellulales bacterium]
MSLSAEKPQPPDALPAKSPTDGQDLPVTLIGPRAGWQPLDLAELWRYRELLFFLTWRDVKVRYKQTLLGAAWAILQPTLMMVVFTLVLGRLQVPEEGNIKYPVLVYAGLLAWTFFANALTNAGQSVVQAERLITKVYFPRLAIPLAAVGAALVDFALAAPVMAALVAYYGGVTVSWTMVFLPVFALAILLAAVGTGTLLAALNVAYRDVRHALPFVTQLWLFATPSVYLPQADTAGWLEINPLNGLVSGFRAAALGQPIPWPRLAYPLLAVAVALAAGIAYFRRVEDSFADVI